MPSYGLSPEMEQALMSQTAFANAVDTARSNPSAYGLGLSISDLLRFYPTMSPGVVYGLASSGIRPGTSTANSAYTLDTAANAGPAYGQPVTIRRPTRAQRRQVREIRKQLQFKRETEGSGFLGLGNVSLGEAITAPIRGAAWGIDKVIPGHIAQDITRTGLTALQSGYEALTGLARETVTSWKDAIADPLGSTEHPGDPNQRILEQTTIYQQATGKSTGDGWLPSFNSEAAKAQADAARRYSPYLIGGHAWTPGRALANVFVSPDDAAFKYLSGAVDAGIALSRLDPASGVLSKVSALRKAAKTFASPLEVAERTGAQKGLRYWLTPKAPEQWFAKEVDNEKGILNTILREKPSALQLHQATGWDYYTTLDNKPLIASIAAKARTPGATPQDLWEILKPYAGTELGNLPLYRTGHLSNTRSFSAVPGAKFFADGDWNTAAKILDDHMVNAQVPFERRQAIMEQVAQAGAGSGARESAIRVTMDTIKESLVASGLDEKTATAWTRYAANEHTEASLYFGKILADPGAGTANIKIGDEILTMGEAPALDTELLHSMVVMPDARSVKRVVSDYNRLVNAPFWKNTVKAADLAMMPWRKLVLMRPAWGIRVIAEEQARIAAHGLTSLYNHPLSQVAWVLGNPESHVQQFLSELEHRPGVRTAIGSAAGAAAGWLVGEAVNQPILGAVGGALLGGHLARTPEAAAKFQSAGEFTASQLQKLQTKYGRGAVGLDGAPFDWLDEGSYNRFEAVTGPRRVDTYDYKLIPTSDPLAGEAMRQEILRTRGSKIMREVLSAPDMAAPKDWFWEGAGQSIREDLAAKGGRYGALGTSREASDNYISALSDAVNRVTNNHPDLIEAFKTGKLRGVNLTSAHQADNIDNIFREIFDSGQGPGHVRIRKFLTLRESDKASTIRSLNNSVNWLFDAMMPRPSNYFSRNPSLRQFYWNRSEELFPYMDFASRERVLRILPEANLGKATEARFVDMHARLADLPIDTPLTYQQADHLAKRFSIDSVKSLLYDLSEKSQLADSMRLIAPFGEAWREIVTRWGKLIWENPQIIRRAQQVIGGTFQSGFFHRDPQTGEEVFVFPGSEWLTDKLIGVPIPLKGRVQGLNLVGNGLPGIGPAVQVPAGYLVPDTPDWKWANNVLFPYGDQTTGNPFKDIGNQYVPSWLGKVIGAFNDPDQVRQYGNTVFDVARYLASTGEYDLQGPEAQTEISRLLTDAKSSAKWFSVIRGFAQSTLPASPAPDWQILDKSGRLVLTWKISEQYNKKLQETNDPGEALHWLIDRYGIDNFMLAQSKSKATIPSPPITDVAAQWSNKRPWIRKDYSTIYGLFAPAGGEFDQNAYEEQFQRGERVKLTPEQMVRYANARLASQVYANQRDNLEADGRRSAADDQTLRELRRQLITDYPGYGDDSIPAAKTEQLIPELQRAAKDPRILKTEAGKALAVYMAERDDTVRLFNEAGHAWPSTAKTATAARSYLASLGERLANQYPSFRAMWDQVLSREVD